MHVTSTTNLLVRGLQQAVKQRLEAVHGAYIVAATKKLKYKRKAKLNITFISMLCISILTVNSTGVQLHVPPCRHTLHLSLVYLRIDHIKHITIM